MGDKIKVIIKRPDEEVGHMTWISDTLENLQRTVEGYIETVTISNDLVIICNEEGRLRGLPRNCSIEHHAMTTDFVGTIIVAGIDEDSFADVPISMKEWRNMLQG